MERTRRFDQRRGLSQPYRIRLLEDDADAAEERDIQMNRKLDRITNLVMAAVFSLATGAILLALNLIALVTTR